MKIVPAEEITDEYLPEDELTRIPFNPNLIDDLRKLFCVDIEPKDLEDELVKLFSYKPVGYEKLANFVDRIELVEHLEDISDYLESIGNSFDNKEVNGIQADFYALRMYLVLSCIDIFATMQYKRFDEWILNNTDDYDKQSDIKDYLKRKICEYKADYGISSNFKKAIRNSTSRVRLETNITVMDANGNTYNRDIDKICESLVRIRNKYTHEGRRITMPPSNGNNPYVIFGGSIVKDCEGSPIYDKPVTIMSDECFDSPFIENRIDKLVVQPGFDLINELRIIAIENARFNYSFLKHHIEE